MPASVISLISLSTVATILEAALIVSISAADFSSIRLPAGTLSAGGKEIFGNRLDKKFMELIALVLLS